MTPPKPDAWKHIGDTNYPTDLWTDGRGELLVIQMRNGLLRSRDLGATWETPIKVGKGFLASVLRGPDGRIVVGDNNSGSVRVSTDHGATWTSVKLPRAQRIQALHATRSHVYALAIERLFRCAAGSDDWVELPLFPDKQKRMVRLDCIAEAPDGTLWIGGWQGRNGTNEGILLRSHDDAAWEPVTVPLALKVVNALALSGKDLYGAGAKRVFRSSDDGATWSDVTPPMLSNSGIKDLVALGDVVTVLESYHVVLRSEDRGGTWTIDHDDQNMMSDQDGLVASSTGHLVLINGLGVFAREEPLAKSVPPAAIAALGVKAAPLRARTAWEDRLDEALGLWKATRDPAAALLVDNVSGQVTGTRALDGLTGNKLQQTWARVAAEGHAADVPALLGTLSMGTLAEVAERVAALSPHADDPRVAHELSNWLATYPYGSTGSKPLWTAAFKLLAQCADERAVAPLHTALAGGVPVTGSVMKAWLESAIPKALDKIEASARRGRKPLTAAQRQQLAALDKAVKSP